MSILGGMQTIEDMLCGRLKCGARFMPFRIGRFYNLSMPFRLQSALRSRVCWNQRAASFFSGLLVVFGLLIPCSVVRGAPGQQVIWNFDQSLTNSLGGGYNSFSREPSWARTYLDPAVHRSASGHSLRITAHREWKGFCGVWFDFYPAGSHHSFDARPHPYLSFWIKGGKPGGDFDIKIVDARGEAHEDTLHTRPLHAYLPRGITTEWQKVTLPLSDFPETDPGSLARMVLVFSVPGDYQFYVDDISFESQINDPVPVSPAGGQEPLKVQETKPYHSMWVWKTKDLLQSAKAADRLFDFCARMGMNRIYLSVDFQGSSGGGPAAIEAPSAYGDFLSAAHRRGLQVEALAGAPAWAANANHALALAAVRAILSFNATMTPNARFDGIHFDVEPYLLLGFAVPDYRERILEEYLEMVAACAEAARSGHLAFTCDIPWWFYAQTPASPNQFTVTFRGKRETVGQHVTDLLDSVTIMDYRNEADGAGGIISSGIPALAYAARVHKKVLIGLETSAQKDTPVEFDLAIPAKEFLARLRETHLAESSSFERYSVHALRAKGVAFIGLGPQHSGPAPRASIATALAHLRKLFGVKSSNQLSVENALGEARSAIAEDPGWNDFQPVEIREPGSRQSIAAFRAIQRTPPVITFHGLGPNVFEEESSSTAEWLSPFSSFGGLAVHYYQSFQALMETP